MAPAAPKAKFTENEKVLCFHGPILYEAKCIKIKKEGGTTMYFVHYQGWNKNWDEWVKEERILKINPENLEKKEKLEAAQKDKKKSTPKPTKKPKSAESANNSRASTPVSDRSFKGATPGPPGSGTRRGIEDDLQSTSSREDDREAPPSKRPRNSTSNSNMADDLDNESGVEDDVTSEPGSLRAEKEVFKFTIPEDLKYVIVNDWDLVKYSKKLFNLPAKITVNSIINEFRKHMEKTADIPAVVVTEVMAGVRKYFDASIEHILLYKIEKPQFQAIMNKDDSKSPSDIYGSAHLLRLMFKLRHLLNQPNISSDVEIIEKVLVQFLKYLVTNMTRFFTSKNYSEASEEYLKTTDA